MRDELDPARALGWGLTQPLEVLRRQGVRKWVSADGLNPLGIAAVEDTDVWLRRRAVPLEAVQCRSPRGPPNRIAAPHIRMSGGSVLQAPAPDTRTLRAASAPAPTACPPSSPPSSPPSPAQPLPAPDWSAPRSPFAPVQSWIFAEIVSAAGAKEAELQGASSVMRGNAVRGRGHAGRNVSRQCIE